MYAAVGCVAGAIIALQIGIMRIFAEGSWAHFGSLVVSLAMLGFGLTSAVMCLARHWFERHWFGVIAGSLAAFAPLVVGANLAAQQLPFNPIFIVSDASQKWRLLANFALYLLPFLAGSLFLGTVFLRAQRVFGRVYFADLLGSGLCGLLTLGSLFLFRPDNLVLVPVTLAGIGGVLWFTGLGSRKWSIGLGLITLAALCVHVQLPELAKIPKLSVSDYKGVSYARKFPDSKQQYEGISPFGHLEVYSSSYLHFAPGLSDNASLNLEEMPANAYLGLYVDGDGPIGVMRDLADKDTAYFHYLPMIYPYLITNKPNTFVVQFGGGISTMVALHSSSKVTVGEANPAFLKAFRESDVLKNFTKDILNRVTVIPYDGRLFLANTSERYDVIDLSLADSAGLSNPGGFAIVEKYSYTQEAMQHYMRALSSTGVLSVTLWNKEEPPKSVLKLFATMAAAARANGDKDISQHFFVASSYLSTVTVLYKRDAFTQEELSKLRQHTSSMSFDEIYSPGIKVDTVKADHVFKDFHDSIYSVDSNSAQATESMPELESEPAAEDTLSEENALTVPASLLNQLAWQALIKDDWKNFSERYLFDVRPLTNNHPYFAAYVFPKDLPKITDRLELFQDEWGYLLLWATLAIACAAGLILIAIPVIFGWRTAFNRYPGKSQTILYFACLGFGYITVEVGLIAQFIQALSNATVSASVLITGMLVFSGIGSFVSDRYAASARTTLPKIFILIGALLIGYSLVLNPILNAIGGLPYPLRLLLCFALIAPPAFLMGFPMATGMGVLTRLTKEHMFLWAWGVNGCFSVIGAALVPIIATSFGLAAVIATAGAVYLLAIPAFFGVLKPIVNETNI
ncbi:MAG: MFS transporter [Gammaproteobacteria bacterium]|nr:MAG: MFS transporter [Gammaproteobacteria bacterium]